MSYVLIIVLIGLGGSIRIAPSEMGLAEHYDTQEACIQTADKLEHMRAYDDSRYGTTCIPLFQDRP